MKYHVPSFWLVIFVSQLINSVMVLMLTGSPWFVFTSALSVAACYYFWREMQKEGDLVITWSGDRIVTVTRQDSEGRILEVLAESGEPPSKRS